jgi:hypothetical protein
MIVVLLQNCVDIQKEILGNGKNGIFIFPFCNITFFLLYIYRFSGVYE